MKASKFFNIQTNKIHVPTVHLKTKWEKKTFFKMKNTIKQPQNQLATPNQSSNFSFALCPFQFQACKKAKEKERKKNHESSELSSSTSSFSYCTSHHPMWWQFNKPNMPKNTLSWLVHCNVRAQYQQLKLRCQRVSEHYGQHRAGKCKWHIELHRGFDQTSSRSSAGESLG